MRRDSDSSDQKFVPKNNKGQSQGDRQKLKYQKKSRQQNER